MVINGNANTSERVPCSCVGIHAHILYIIPIIPSPLLFVSPFIVLYPTTVVISNAKYSNKYTPNSPLKQNPK